MEPGLAQRHFDRRHKFIRSKQQGRGATVKLHDIVGSGVAVRVDDRPNRLQCCGDSRLRVDLDVIADGKADHRWYGDFLQGRLCDVTQCAVVSHAERVRGAAKQELKGDKMSALPRPIIAGGRLEGGLCKPHPYS
jgi:hypothetical protein